MKLGCARFLPISLTLRAPLTTAHGVVHTRQGFALALEDVQGHTGWGECLPLPGFGLETPEQTRPALRTGVDALLGRELTGLDAALDIVDASLPRTPAVRAAFDLALHDLFARRSGLCVADLLAKAPREEIGVAALLGGPDPGAVAESAREARSAGFRTLKLKVGVQPLDEDAMRVRAVRSAAPEARLRLDANGAWSEVQARGALEALADARLELVEQPVAGDAAAFARLRQAAAIPIAADESIRDVESALHFLGANAVDALVLKPAALGGLRAATRIAGRAREHGVACIVTSFLDSSLGLAGALELARALPHEDLDHGLATDAWLRDDIASLPTPHLGRRDPGPELGLGITPDPARLAHASDGASETFTA